MEISEKRIIASLILLTGVTLLTLAIYNGQLATIVELIKQTFDPSVAGVP
jgi:hypothetical protein